MDEYLDLRTILFGGTTSYYLYLHHAKLPLPASCKLRSHLILHRPSNPWLVDNFQISNKKKWDQLPKNRDNSLWHFISRINIINSLKLIGIMLIVTFLTLLSLDISFCNYIDRDKRSIFQWLDLSCLRSSLDMHAK